MSLKKRAMWDRTMGLTELWGLKNSVRWCITWGIRPNYGVENFQPQSSYELRDSALKFGQPHSSVQQSYFCASLTHSHTMTPIDASGKQALLKTLWEKEKLLVTSNFSFSRSVFYLFG